MNILQSNNKDQIKRLLEAEKWLGAIIDILTPHKDELPAGAFQHLTAAENLIQNRRAGLEQEIRSRLQDDPAACWNSLANT